MQQEGVGSNAQGDVMMQPSPISPFILAQAKLLLQFPIVTLDAPAHLGNEHPLLNQRIRRQDREEVLQRFRIAFRPLDQQPLLGTLGVLPIVTVGGTDAHYGKREFSVSFVPSRGKGVTPGAHTLVADLMPTA